MKVYVKNYLGEEKVCSATLLQVIFIRIYIRLVVPEDRKAIIRFLI